MRVGQYEPKGRREKETSSGRTHARCSAGAGVAYSPPALTRKMYARINSHDLNECWIWQGYTVQGCGSIKYHGKKYLAHRWFWEQENGLINRGPYLLNHCGNKRCCNPTHYHLSHKSWEPPEGYVQWRWWTEKKIEALVPFAMSQPAHIVAKRFGVSYDAIVGIVARLPDSVRQKIRASRRRNGILVGGAGRWSENERIMLVPALENGFAQEVAGSLDRSVESVVRTGGKHVNAIIDYDGGPMCPISRRSCVDLMRGMLAGDSESIAELMKQAKFEIRRHARRWLYNTSNASQNEVVADVYAECFLSVASVLDMGELSEDTVKRWFATKTKTVAWRINNGQGMGRRRVLVGVLDEELVLGNNLSERSYEQRRWRKDIE